MRNKIDKNTNNCGRDENDFDGVGSKYPLVSVGYGFFSRLLSLLAGGATGKEFYVNAANPD